MLSLVSGPFSAMLGLGLLMLLLCEQVSLVGMLMNLPRAFMSGQMIFGSVVFRPGQMGVGSQVTMLGSYML
jgi:hypothetical protein